MKTHIENSENERKGDCREKTDKKRIN